MTDNMTDKRIAEQAEATLSRQDWSLHRKGPADQARHQEKVREAIRQNLPEIVSEEAIITSDGKRLVKVPIRSLELPHFRFSPGGEQVGQGSGGSKVGDVVAREGDAPSPGRGPGAGDQPGVDYYEAEITVDELAELVFQDLQLPDLKPKPTAETLAESVRFDEVRKRGAFANLDKRRTLLQNLKRNALGGHSSFGSLRDDDLRFKSWTRELRRETSAVVLAMRDVSGSMGEFEKYVTRSFYFWMVRFLRSSYRDVEIVFITHHSEAREVDEEAFFKLGESGGTRASSAYRLALEVVARRFDPTRWNVYPFHFSDGDNWSDDNADCLRTLRQLLEVCNLFGYGEIRRGVTTPPLATSTLMRTFAALSDPRFLGVTIADKRDVYPALKQFFGRREVAGVR